MEDKTEQLRSLLKKVEHAVDYYGGLFITKTITDLFTLMGVKEEILGNPNKKAIPLDVYSILRSLTSRALIEVTDNSIVIKQDNTRFKRSGHLEHRAKVVLEVFNGELKTQAFYKNFKDDNVLRTCEVLTYKNVDGDEVIKTMEGDYRVEANSHYIIGTYLIKDFSLNGLNNGVRKIITENPYGFISSPSFDSFVSLDAMVRSKGLEVPINAKTPKDVSLMVADSYVIDDVIVYRNDNEIDKVHVKLSYFRGNYKEYLCFPCYCSHGIDDLDYDYNYFGDDSRLLAEDEFDKTRAHFYASSDIEYTKMRSSKVAIFKLDEIKKKIDNRRQIPESCFVKKKVKNQ